MRRFCAFHLCKRVAKVFVARVGVARVEVAAFFLNFEQLLYGFGAQKSESAGVGDGGIDTAKFAKILKVVDFIGWIVHHFCLLEIMTQTYGYCLGCKMPNVTPKSAKSQF